MNYLRLLRVHRHSILKISSINVSQHPSKFAEKEQKWKEKDDIPKQYQLIYKAPMENILKYATTYLTFTSSTIGLGAIYYGIFVFEYATMNAPVILGDDVVVANSSLECLIYLMAFVSFHVAVKILLSKYVVRLYKDDDKYIAVFRGHFFDSINKHEFNLDEFKKIRPNLAVSWSDARFSLGKKHGILLEHYFKTPEYFNQLVYKKKNKTQSNEEDKS